MPLTINHDTINKLSYVNKLWYFKEYQNIISVIYWTDEMHILIAMYLNHFVFMQYVCKVMET